MKKLIIAILMLFSTSLHAAPMLSSISPAFEHIKPKLNYTIQTMYLDPNDEIALTMAINEWNKAMGYEFLMREENRYMQASIYVIKVGMKGLHGLASPFNVDTCMVLVSDTMNDDPGLYIHELGHCFGLAHNPKKNTTMSLDNPKYYWNIDNDSVFTIKLFQDIH